MRDTCRVGQQGVHARLRRAMARAILPTRNKPCDAPLPTVRHRRFAAAKRRLAQGRHPVACDAMHEGSLNGGIGKIFRKISSAFHRLDQLVVEAFVGQENGTFGFHSRDRRLDLSR